MNFRADEIAFEACDGEYVAYASFRGAGSGNPHYLVISRSVFPGERTLPFIEIDDQCRSAEGGILKYELQARQLYISVDDATAKELRLVNGKEVTIEFSIQPDELSGLRSALESIFAGIPTIPGS